MDQYGAASLAKARKIGFLVMANGFIKLVSHGRLVRKRVSRSGAFKSQKRPIVVFYWNGVIEVSDRDGDLFFLFGRPSIVWHRWTARSDGKEKGWVRGKDAALFTLKRVKDCNSQPTGYNTCLDLSLCLSNLCKVLSTQLNLTEGNVRHKIYISTAMHFWTT